MRNLGKILLSSALLWCGCGGGSNNDQGMSFSLIGFNAVDESNRCQLDVFTTGTTIVVTSGAFELASQDAYACVNVQNNMSTQFVRADRLLLSYFVAGADIQPPSTTTAFSALVGPVRGITSPPSSLPPGFDAPNQITVGGSIVPPPIIEWLYVNRNSLPPAPYHLNVNVQVSAVTSSGDRIVSNPSDFLVFVQSEPLTGGAVPTATPSAVEEEEFGEEEEL